MLKVRQCSKSLFAFGYCAMYSVDCTCRHTFIAHALIDYFVPSPFSLFLFFLLFSFFSVRIITILSVPSFHPSSSLQFHPHPIIDPSSAFTSLSLFIHSHPSLSLIPLPSVHRGNGVFPIFSYPKRNICYTCP